jgi:UDP-glucose 4-epimerase
MKALVIGGNGFIGSHLVDRLLVEGWEISILDVIERRYDPLPGGAHFIQGDLSQAYLLREALSGVDVVYHLAWTTVHETSIQDPAADAVANLIPAIRLFETCIRTEVKRVVFTSSGGTVYGQPESLPIKESHPQNPINAYGITKLSVEKYLHMFQRLHGLDYAILRPSVPYGPRQNPHGLQGAVAVFLHRVSQDLPIKIWGDGSSTRDFFFVSDLVRALVTVADFELSDSRVFNIGGGEAISLSQLLGKIEETVGRTAKIVYEPRRNFDADQIVLDTSLATRVLGWQPEVNLQEGLSRTWSWMSEYIARS